MRLQKYCFLALVLLLATPFPKTTILAEESSQAPSTRVTGGADDTALPTEIAPSSGPVTGTSQEEVDSPSSTSQAEEPVEPPRDPQTNPPEEVAPPTPAPTPIRGALVALPTEVVGTWTANRMGASLTITIRQDGSGSQVLHDPAGNITITSSFQIGQLELVGDQLYRYVDGTNTSGIGFGGLGGYNVKFETGFYFGQGQFQPVVWQTGLDEEFDYSQGYFAEAFSRVVDTPQETPSSEQVTPIKQAKSVQTKKVRPTATLPATGEQTSPLALLGFLLITLAGFGVNKEKLAKNHT